MAKLYFDANDKSLVVSNNNTEVIGLSGTGVESVTIAQGVTNVTLRQNIEQLVLNGASSTYKYQQAGATLKIYATDGTTLIATVPVQGGSADIGGDGTLIQFTDGTASAKLTSGVMTLGGATLSTTAGAATPSLTGGSTPITFSLDQATYDVTEGNTLTFKISASAPVQAATNVRYNIVGDASQVGTAATASTDYTPASATVNFASGESEKVITITVPNDGATEGFEGAKIRLLSSSFAELDSAMVAIEDGPELAKTLSLTTGGDSFQGSAQADTFYATLNMSSGGSLNADTTTLNTNDTINGGAGVDTLNITARGDASEGASLETPVPVLNGIEKIFFSTDVTSNTGAGWFGVNLSSTESASLTDIGVTTAFSNAKSTAFFQLVPSNVDVSMRGQGDLAVSFQSGVMAGSADTLDLTLNGVGQSTSTGVDSSTFGVAKGGVETLHITSNTSSNYLTLNNGQGGTGQLSGLQKVTVDGSKDLYLKLNADTGTGSVALDANGFSGNLTVEGISTGAVTLTGGAGNDTFNFSISGSGSSFDAGTGTSKDSLVGGDGVDILKLGTQSTDVVDAQFKNATSIEILSLGSGSTGTLGVNADAAGIIKVIDSTGSGDTIHLTLASGFDNAITVELYGTGGDTITATASTASLTVKSAITGLTGDTLAAGTGTGTTDVLEISAGGTGTLSTGITDFDKVVVTANGSSGLNLTTVDQNVASGKTLVVDATALTNTSAALSFTGTGEANGAFSIAGGAGNDTLYLGSGNDTVSGGDGTDTIDGSAGGNDSLLGGAGNDTFNMGNALSSGDTIVGGSGDDTLVITNTTVTSSQFTNVSEIETLSLGSGSVNLSSNITFSTFDLTNSGATALTLSTTGYTNATTVQLGSGDSVNNSANAPLTVNVSNQTGALGSTGVLSVTGGSGTDTVNITADNSSGVTNLATGSSIDVINILDSTGTGDHDVYLNATGGYVGNLKVDASALDAGTLTGAAGTALFQDEQLTFDATNAAGKFTVLGGGGVDTITLGSGNDSADGGDGADSINGGAGNDTLSGGAGGDTLISGLGNDSISGGDGDDRIVMGTGTSGAVEGYLQNPDTVNGGAGNDTLVIQSTGSTFNFAYTNVSSIENLELTAGGASTTGHAVLFSSGLSTVTLNDTGAGFSVNADSYTTSISFDLGTNTGNVTLQGGSASDTFIVASTGVLASGDSLVGGDGTDILRLDNGTGAGTAVSATLGTGVSSIESVVINDLSTGTAGDATLTIQGYGSTGTGFTLSVDGTSLDTGETLTVIGTGFSSQALSVVGGAGNDTFTGGDGKDTLAGGAGTDSLMGAVGSDNLDGGDGADTLVGAAGSDTLTGGAGNDVFYFGSGGSTSNATDTVTDFAVGSDQIQFVLNANGTGFVVNATDKGLTSAGGSDISDPNFAGGNWTAGHIGQYVFSNGSTNKQLVVDSDGNAAYQGSDGLVTLSGLTGISDTDLRFDIQVAQGATTGTVTAGAGEDTLTFLGTGGATVTINGGIESVVGSTGADTIILGATGQTVNVISSGGADTISGSTGADTIVLGGGTNETGYVFGATGTGYNFDANFGKSGADTINLGTGASDNDTIVFGTGATGGTISLTVDNFDASGSSDVIDLTSITAGTGLSTTWYNLDATASGDLSLTGGSTGVIFAYSADALASGDLTTGGGASGSDLQLSGSTDYVVVIATGAADGTLDMYYVNSNLDGTGGSFSSNDIKLIGTLDLLGSDTAAQLVAGNFDLT